MAENNPATADCFRRLKLREIDFMSQNPDKGTVGLWVCSREGVMFFFFFPFGECLGMDGMCLIVFYVSMFIGPKRRTPRAGARYALTGQSL